MATRRDLLRGAAAAAGGLLIESCHGMPPAATPGSVASPPGAGAGSAPGAGTAPVGASVVPGALTVSGTRLIRDGKPFFVSGFNYWSALPLSREGNTAGWDQVRRDLDGLQSAGINMIRTMGSSEGPDTEPFRIVPSLQPAQGQYDAASVAGLARLIEELEKRKLQAILIMNNFWQWSGGMPQYMAWAGEGAIPYPPPFPGGSWDAYQRHAGQFYRSEKAKDAFRAFLTFMVPKLSNSPSVIWELCNEPRGMNNVGLYRKWIDDTAALIKSLAPGQLVTTGSEGQTATPGYAGLDTVKDHESKHIDFVTAHMWAQNWGWVKPEHLDTGFPKAVDLAKKYINDHAARATKVGKPIILEEFGFPRDGGSFDPDSPTTLRDRYFEEVYALVHALMPTTPYAGIMPWAWAGDARPARPGEYWKPGDPFIGDPPHEQQGWYSIYGKDTTMKIIRDWSARAVVA